MKSLVKIVLTLNLVLFHATSYSALIDAGNTTIDDMTGLKWLDLSETFGRSYVDVSSKLSAGGEFEGYRYATLDEVLTLTENAGVSGYVNDFNDFNYQPMTDLLKLLVGLPLNGNEIQIGGTLSTINNINWRGAYNDRTVFMINNIDKTAVIGASTIWVEGSGFYTGHWLVSAVQVPEPSTFWLFLSGIVFIFAVQKKHREKWHKSFNRPVKSYQPELTTART